MCRRQLGPSGEVGPMRSLITVRDRCAEQHTWQLPRASQPETRCRQSRCELPLITAQYGDPPGAGGRLHSTRCKRDMPPNGRAWPTLRQRAAPHGWTTHSARCDAGVRRRSSRHTRDCTARRAGRAVLRRHCECSKAHRMLQGTHGIPAERNGAPVDAGHGRTEPAGEGHVQRSVRQAPRTRRHAQGQRADSGHGAAWPQLAERGA